MNYKDTISAFRRQFENEQFNRKQTVRNLTDREIMFELSAIQSYLQNTYKIYDKVISIKTAIGQSKYTVGNGVTDIPTDVLDIKNVATANGTIYDNLKPISKEQMNVRTKDVLTSYTVYGSGSAMILEIDFTPTVAGNLYIQYSPRLDLFDSNAGTTSNKTFSDTNYVETTLLGSWLIPEDWHLLLIDGAIASYFRDLKAEWYELCDSKYQKRLQPINLTLPSQLGNE